MERDCPRCRVPLHRVSAGPVEVEGCGQCGGLWFDAGELQQLAREAPATALTLDERSGARGSSAPALGKCPACGAPLRESPIASSGGRVAAHACGKCAGVWLDHGQLRQLAAPSLATSAVHTSPRDPAGGSPMCPCCGASAPPRAAFCRFCYWSLGDMDPIESSSDTDAATIPAPWRWAAAVALIDSLLFAMALHYQMLPMMLFFAPVSLAVLAIALWVEHVSATYTRGMIAFARQSHFALRWRAGALVERFAPLDVVFNWAPRASRVDLTDSAPRVVTGSLTWFHSGPVLHRETARERFLAFDMQRFHYIQNATGFYGRAVAVLSREGARFPDTSIRPKLLETAAATVRGWVGGAEPDPAEAFDARFGVECADAAFLQRFLTRELKQLLLQDRTCSLQLANDTVAVGPATEHPYKTRIPVADYERALLLARTGMEAARRAGGPAEEPDARR